MEPGRRSERQAWIALASVPGVGDVTFARLLAECGSASAALERVAGLPGTRSDHGLAALLGQRCRPGLAAAIRARATDPDLPVRQMERLGGWLLTPFDAAYPARLRRIEDPPPVIYGLGSPAALSAPRQVAVVGTRHPTTHGRSLASRIGTWLAQAGATVVSGLAVGVDGAAHLAALDAGGASIGVVGSGLDTPGPVAHRVLARRLMSHGAVISELAPGVHATAGTYPRRNRIVSGLASATIVVEAPARSGALITARLSLEQGRALLVAPGRPLDPAVAGNLALLRESPARPLVGLAEMLVDLGLDVASEREPGAATRHGVADLSLDGALALLGVSERSVAVALAQGPRTIDHLVRACGQPAGVVAAALTLLQLRGWATVMGSVNLPAGPLLRAAAASGRAASPQAEGRAGRRRRRPPVPPA